MDASRITNEDSNFIYGVDIIDGVEWPWMKTKHSHWSSLGASDLIKRCGFDIGATRSQGLINFADGNADVIYYIASLEHEEALKWLMGPIAVDLKTSEVPLQKLMSAVYLNAFVSYLVNDKFNKTFAKDIFAEFLEVSKLSLVDPTYILDEIIKQSKYKVVDTSEIDLVITKVLSNNIEQTKKAKNEPKLIHWLVGQCMKELKGKASAPALQVKIAEALINY